MSKKETTFEHFFEMYVTLRTINIQKRDRLSLAAIGFEKNLSYPNKKYEKERIKILRETASVDEDGNFYQTEKGEIDYNRITPNKDEQRQRMFEELMHKKIEIEPCITNDLTRVKKLPLPVIKIFNGWLWDLTAEQIEQIYLEGEEETLTPKTDGDTTK